MTGMRAFGDPDRFEISARWIQDHEHRDRLPKSYGWSMGELCIKVGGVTLTEHRIHGEHRQAIQWYLGPVVSWFLVQWKWLMHEEAYTWSTSSADSAAFTVEADIERCMASEYSKDRLVYKEIRAWWQRHALRSADASALLPSVFIRRVEDSIEVSWLEKQPDFPPDGFALNLHPGTALFSIREVAEPLWEFLRWAIETAQPVTEADHDQVEALRSRFSANAQTDLAELEAAHLTNEILLAIKKNTEDSHWRADTKGTKNPPVVTEFNMPVLMFGGLNVCIEDADIRQLLGILAQQRGGNEFSALTNLVSSPSIYEYLRPYVQAMNLPIRLGKRSELIQLLPTSTSKNV